MRRTGRRPDRGSSAALAVVAFMLAACDSGSTTTTTATTDPESGTTSTTVPAVEPVEIIWNLGVGIGSSPEEVEAQQEIANAFNSTHPGIKVITSIPTAESGVMGLEFAIEAGNPPDLIGPLDGEAAHRFHGLYLPLDDLLAASATDLSVWPEAAVDNLVENGDLYGLPFASYPSVMLYNTRLFDAARLPYPPSAFGAKYGIGTKYEGDWTFEKLEEIAMLLTKDSSGKNGAQSGFRRTEAVQWGFSWQGNDRLFEQGSFWGAGSPLRDDGTVQIPQAWIDEWNWYHLSIWRKGFSPSGQQLESEALAGDPFGSGRVAMVIVPSSLAAALVEEATDQGSTRFNLAAIPSRQGQVVAPIRAETFRILASTQHPEEAFEFYRFLVNSEGTFDLLAAYGAAPAIPALSTQFYAALRESSPEGVAWDVINRAAEYADAPSHQQYLPGWNGYVERMEVLLAEMQAKPNLNLGAAVRALEADLRRIFADNG